jgi:hypothetical protein
MIAIPRWTNRSMFISKTFAVADPSEIMASIAAVQALNLLSGRMIKSCWKSMSQPRIVFLSSNGALDSSLLQASIISQGIGVFGSRGWEKVSNMRRGAQSHEQGYLFFLLRL